MQIIDFSLYDMTESFTNLMVLLNDYRVARVAQSQN